MTGFINLNKAEGVSSAAEVSKIKRLTGTPCGHMGTLDPMATGVLPVAIGNAARLFDYFLTKKKVYVATFRFGEDYDTLDVTGKLIGSSNVIPDCGQIEEIIPSLVGDVMQIPPLYSAKCVNGKRGYELARQGITVVLQPKKVTIDKIVLLERCDERSFSFEISCGGGTYIRSIARDMAKALGTVAAMSALTRVASGPFKIENSVGSERLTAENIKDYIIPCDACVPFASIYPSGKDAKKLFNGMAIECGQPDGIYKIYDENRAFYGLAAVENGILKVRTKLC